MLEKNALVQLTLCNIRGYLREPEAIFWTYGFPLLMIIGLGVAFQGAGNQPIAFDVVAGDAAREVVAALGNNEGFKITVRSAAVSFDRLRGNKTPVVIVSDESGGFEYHYDPSNPESKTARSAIDDALQRAAGRTDPRPARDVTVTAPGSRYVDFLVPGLIGMNLMGGGMWGVGFGLVDKRMKKLLKRLIGTPLRRPQFLLSVVGPRLLFFVPEAFVLLGAAHLIFGVPIQGSILSIFVVGLTGAMTFAGLGLLAASRARRIETISGIMNLVMLPMWLCSGIFFSAERFPQFMQPFIQALPLTQLINALRAVILEGQSLLSQGLALSIMAAWMSVSFLLAPKWFRWS